MHQRARDFRNGQRGDVGQERRAARIPLALDHRPAAVRQVIQRGFQLRLDQRALVLDDDHAFETGAELAHALRLQRPGHGDLVDGEAQAASLFRRQTKCGERFEHIARSLTSDDQAKPRARRGQDHMVEPVGAHIGLRGG